MDNYSGCTDTAVGAFENSIYPACSISPSEKLRTQEGKNTRLPAVSLPYGNYMCALLCAKTRFRYDNLLRADIRNDDSR